MITPAIERRKLRTIDIEGDLIVVGGGMAGVCCAITAARAGIQVVLVQDRPVLGGNASSEVRLWILGATSHMGNNNRWAREGGVIDEILVENMYRNPEGNPIIFDTILLERVTAEPNLTLLLNTAAHDLEVGENGRIRSVRAFCSQNSTQYELIAPLFCDASGDGIMGFLSGAAFRIGAESRVEFGEQLAPPEPRHELLGHSIYFYTRDTGRPVRFVPPRFALDDITKIPRYRQFNTKEHGCQLWWIEYGGNRDTVYETEEIKWELWKIVYGVWNYIKNSGEFPDAENLTLEWVGTIPGKRESRRFEGDYMLTQQDIVDQHIHHDAVSFGGWAIDLHPAEGIYSAESPCQQWHSMGVYQIPYRIMYSRNVPNLFFAGRILSASHIAFGSTRVMATCAHNAQAAGMAAALCARGNVLPSELVQPERIGTLQTELLRAGQYIPHVASRDKDDLAQTASISATSCMQLAGFKRNEQWIPLTDSRAMLLPVPSGRVPEITFPVKAYSDTNLEIQLRASSRPGNFTPDVILERQLLTLRGDVSASYLEHGDHRQGAQFEPMKTSAIGSDVAVIPRKQTRTESVTVHFQTQVSEACYVMICLIANPHIAVQLSDQRVTGVASLVHRENSRVAKSSVQTPPEGFGIDRFEFWTPERRPQGKNLAFHLDRPLDVFAPQNVVNGVARPTVQPNAWVASWDDPQPTLEFRWVEPQKIRTVELSFDTDFDHAMESVLMGHPERVMPFCIRNYRIRGYAGQLLASKQDNYQTRNTIRVPARVRTDVLSIEFDAPSDVIPASVLEVRFY